MSTEQNNGKPAVPPKRNLLNDRRIRLLLSLLGAVIMDVSTTGWDCLTGCTGWLGWTGWVGWTGCCAGIATAGLAAGWRRFCGIG